VTAAKSAYFEVIAVLVHYTFFLYYQSKNKKNGVVITTKNGIKINKWRNKHIGFLIVRSLQNLKAFKDPRGDL